MRAPLILAGLVLLGLCGCGTAGSSPSVPGATAATSASPALGTPYPLEGMTEVPRPAIATVTGADGWVFTLHAVRRVAADRVVVEGLLDGTKAKQSGIGDWNDPRTDSRQNGFGGVSLMRDGDPRTYLPVLNEQQDCLCTHLPSRWQSAFPVYVVMEAPAEDDKISLLLNTAGSIGPLEVTR